jgi:hypothetical protein
VPRERTPRSNRDGARAEQQLLRVILASADWRERARGEVRPEWFEGREYREIFDVLMGEGGADPAGLGERLSSEARRVWAALVESIPGLEGQQLDQNYSGACRTLEARPLFRELEVLTQRIQAAPPEQQPALLDEKNQRVNALKARYPDEWEQRGPWRRLRGLSTTPTKDR